MGASLKVGKKDEGHTRWLETQRVHCLKKVPYGADRVRKVARRKRQRAYHCPVCGHWHLTTINRDGYRGGQGGR